MNSGGRRGRRDRGWRVCLGKSPALGVCSLKISQPKSAFRVRVRAAMVVRCSKTTPGC
jgi:hypothetical protein